LRHTLYIFAGGVFIVIFVGIGLACITLAIEYWWYKFKKAPQITDAGTVVVQSRQIPTAAGGKMETVSTKQGFRPRNPVLPGHKFRLVLTLLLLQIFSYNVA
jgi:hypothetical protein